jgi:hypothetical protein
MSSGYWNLSRSRAYSKRLARQDAEGVTIPAALDHAITHGDALAVANELSRMGKAGRATLPSGVRGAYAALVEARGADALALSLEWLFEIARYSLLGCATSDVEERAS